MGGPKALLRIEQQTFLERCCRLFDRPGVAEIVVVLGHEAGRVAAEGGIPQTAVLVTNAGYREGGMLSSLLAGLGEAERGAMDAVLVHPVDHPLVAPETIDRVAAALHAGARIAVPSFEDRRGHPAGFGRDTWQALRNAPAAEGARSVLRSHPEWITHVAGEPGSVTGVNTPEDYARLKS